MMEVRLQREVVRLLDHVMSALSQSIVEDALFTDFRMVEVSAYLPVQELCAVAAARGEFGGCASAVEADHAFSSQMLPLLHEPAVACDDEPRTSSLAQVST